MVWVRRPLILVVIALVIANAQCVAACTAARCDHSNSTSASKNSADLPPCHRHHAPKQPDAPKPCTDSILLVDGRVLLASAANQSAGIPIAALPQTVLYESLTVHAVNRIEAASPPTLTRWLSLTVIRV